MEVDLTYKEVDFILDVISFALDPEDYDEDGLIISDMQRELVNKLVAMMVLLR